MEIKVITENCPRRRQFSHSSSRGSDYPSLISLMVYMDVKHHVYLRPLDQTDDLLIASWALYHLAMFLYPRVSTLTPFHGSADHRHLSIVSTG